jgi:hypothetical protein
MFPSLRSLISGLFAGDFPANMTDLIKTPAVPICGSLLYFNLCSSESLIAEIVIGRSLWYDRSTRVRYEHRALQPAV